MIELTEQQMQALEHPEATPPRVVNPRTKETFVLLRVDEYERLKEDEYDDSPWTSEERHALAWEAGKHGGGRTWTSTTTPGEAMNRGDVILVRFPHPSGAAREEAAGRCRAVRCLRGNRWYGRRRRGHEEPDDGGRSRLSAHRREHTEGKATGLIHNSVVSCLLLADRGCGRRREVLGALSPTMKQKLDSCLRAALGLP